MKNKVITATGRQVRRFGMRDRIGYMFGDFGNDFTFLLQSTYFMLFYTNVVGINPAHIGTMLFAARILDAFTDVGMGIIIDRLPNKHAGYKFKRWIKWIAIPVAAASVLMYMAFVANFSSYGLKLVWMCATYLLWGSLCYTAINIPYGSMASVISPNPDDRAQLSVWRSTGANLANLAITATLPLIVYVTTADGRSALSGSKMMIAALVCSVLAVICYSILYFNVEERVEEVKVEDKNNKSAKNGLGKMLVSVFTNRALLGLIVAALFLLLSMLFLMQMAGYLFLNNYGDGKLQSPASMAAVIPSFILIIAAPWLAKKFGKAEVGIVAMACAGIVLIVAFVLKIQNPIVWIVFYAIAMFGISVFNFLVWAFITDVIDYQEVRTGARDDGTVYAVYSWARKLGQALAGLLVGVGLSAVGYSASAASAGDGQHQSVLDGIYMLANLVPGVGVLLVAVALLLLYPLKKKAVEENVRILAERKQEKLANVE